MSLLNALSTLAFLLLPVCHAATIYDLKTNWSDTNNPNGVWAYRQGTTILSHQTDIGTVCCGTNSGIIGGWSQGGPRGSIPITKEVRN